MWLLASGHYKHTMSQLMLGRNVPGMDSERWTEKNMWSKFPARTFPIGVHQYAVSTGSKLTFLLTTFWRDTRQDIFDCDVLRERVMT